jgi:hypothetical protein
MKFSEEGRLATKHFFLGIGWGFAWLAVLVLAEAISNGLKWGHL